MFVLIGIEAGLALVLCVSSYYLCNVKYIPDLSDRKESFKNEQTYLLGTQLGYAGAICILLSLVTILAIK